MGERRMERETGAGEKSEKDREEREREIGRETGVGDRETKKERETGEKKE